MKVGARNRLTAEVIEIKRGAVMCEVKVRLKAQGDMQMASVMTLESLDELGLQPGDQVQVVAKAVNVLLMKG
jgi:molybdopterin-binding protein